MSTKQKINVDDGRIQRLKESTIDIHQKIDFERLEYMVQVYKEYADYSPAILRARFFERLLDNKKIYIDDNLFVGSIAGEPGAFYIYPEWNPSWLKDDNKFDIPEEKSALLNEVGEYWEKRCLAYQTTETVKNLYGKDLEEAIIAGQFTDLTSSPSGVSNSNYERAIKEGLASIIKEAEKNYKNLDVTIENKDKFDFYQSVIIEAKAVIRYAERYAKLAKSLAEKEENEARKQEYLDIEEICTHVPEKPARNLREAIQSHFFVHLASELEQVGCGVSQGFLGQTLEPFYQKDKKDGILDEEQATYLLKHFFLKLNDISYYYGQRMDVSNSGDTAQTISIGGYTEEGRDATAQLDYLILDAQQDLRLPQPPLAVIFHDKLKPKFVNKCFELVKTGIGMPQFMNADILVERSLDAYSRYGATIGDARRTCVYGCVSTAIPNKTAYLMETTVNVSKALELAIYNGKDPISGLQVGLKTGEFTEFKDFDQIYEAFEKQLDNAMFLGRKASHIYNQLGSKFFPLPLRSALTDGCLESGKDMWNDGAKYSATALVLAGGIDAANSLLAIKDLVFDKKRITLAELKKALEDDFEGYEIIQKLCTSAPKYGNSDQEAEDVVQRVYKTTFDSFQKVGENYFGKYGKPDAYSKSVHNYFGILSGALPNGRKAYRPLTDGSVSATPGTDVKGPSVLVSSAAQGIDTVAFNSAHLNVKVNPIQLNSEKGNQALFSLIKGYMDQGGNHIQFNCVDSKVLKDAQKHPEQHKNLVVRVAGFSAFFTRLHPGIQDELIARTEHSLAV